MTQSVRTKLQYWTAIVGGAVLGIAETGVIDIGGDSHGGLITMIIVAIWGAVQSHYDTAKLGVATGENNKGVMTKVAQARALSQIVKQVRKKK